MTIELIFLYEYQRRINEIIQLTQNEECNLLIGQVIVDNFKLEDFDLAQEIDKLDSAIQLAKNAEFNPIGQVIIDLFDFIIRCYREHISKEETSNGLREFQKKIDYRIEEIKAKGRYWLYHEWEEKELELRKPNDFYKTYGPFNEEELRKVLKFEKFTPNDYLLHWFYNNPYYDDGTGDCVPLPPQFRQIKEYPEFCSELT